MAKRILFSCNVGVTTFEVMCYCFYCVLMITLILLFFRSSAALQEEDQISQQKDETKVTTENGAILKSPKSPKSPDPATLEKLLTSGPDTPL